MCIIVIIIVLVLISLFPGRENACGTALRPEPTKRPLSIECPSGGSFRGQPLLLAALCTRAHAEAEAEAEAGPTCHTAPAFLSTAPYRPVWPVCQPAQGPAEPCWACPERGRGTEYDHTNTTWTGLHTSHLSCREGKSGALCQPCGEQRFWERFLFSRRADPDRQSDDGGRSLLVRSVMPPPCLLPIQYYLWVACLSFSAILFFLYACIHTYIHTCVST